MDGDTWARFWPAGLIDHDLDSRLIPAIDSVDRGCGPVAGEPVDAQRSASHRTLPRVWTGNEAEDSRGQACPTADGQPVGNLAIAQAIVLCLGPTDDSVMTCKVA